MKYVLIFLCCVLIPMCVVGQDVSVSYVTELETVQDLGMPMSIAADSNGGLYYTLFSIPAENLSGCYYIPNPLDAPPPDQHVLVEDGLEHTIPRGRGFMGVSVDSQGFVYLALETGNAASSGIVKRSPAPDFEYVAEFGDGGMVLPEQRTNSVEVITDSILAVSTFSTVEFWDAATGGLLYDVAGGETYQRDMAYNPNNDDIYIAKNRDVSGIPISCASLLSGGSPDNLAGYATIQPNFIPQGGAGSQYGINLQLIEYDPVNNLIIIPSCSPSEPLPEGEVFQTGFSFYSPEDTSAPVAFVDASESPNGPITRPGDAVAVQVEGQSYVFVTDSLSDEGLRRIVVFQIGGGTPVADWPLH